MSVAQKLALKRNKHVEIYESLQDNPHFYIENFDTTKLFLQMEKELLLHIKKKGLLSRYSYETKGIQKMKEHSQENGYHFFDEKTMRFFQTKVKFIGNYGLFLTEETNPQDKAAYTVRILMADGSVETLGGFHIIEDIPTALKMTKNLGQILDECLNYGEDL